MKNCEVCGKNELFPEEEKTGICCDCEELLSLMAIRQSASVRSYIEMNGIYPN